MIAVLEKPTGSSKSALDYNYKKVNREVAEVFDTKNIALPENKEYIYRLFKERENSLNLRANAKNFSFHMSVNPATGEMDDPTAKKFIRELMEEVGYGKQPFVVFKHYDIRRHHFHVVSTNVNEHQKVMRDSYKNYKIYNALQKLQSKYSYTIGRNRSLHVDFENSLRFNPEEPVVQQMENILERCNQYWFENLQQLRLLLLTMRVDVEKEERRLMFYGVDATGKKNTKIIGGINHGAIYSILKRLTEDRHTDKENEDIKKVILDTAATNSSFKDFCIALAGIGISVSTEKDKNKNILRLSFIDHPAGYIYDSDELEITAFLLSHSNWNLAPYPDSMPCIDIWDTLLKKAAHKQAAIPEGTKDGTQIRADKTLKKPNKTTRT